MCSSTKSYALITGATSGIGYELAKQAAKDGRNVVLVARDVQELEKVAKEIESFYNVDALIIPKDLFDEHAAEEIYHQTRDMGLTIDVLINDAGQGQHGKFVEEDLERHLDIIRLNIISLVSLTYYYLQEMLDRGEGYILQVGSEVSKAPTPLLNVYAASKSFVLSFTEGLINELEDTGVSMTLLMPGATDTDFFDKADMEDTKVYREGKLDEPEEVAAMAYKALMEGDRRIIGPLGKKNVMMANMTPDNLLAKSNRKKMEPSDKDSDEVRHAPQHRRSREVHDKAAAYNKGDEKLKGF